MVMIKLLIKKKNGLTKNGLNGKLEHGEMVEKTNKARKKMITRKKKNKNLKLKMTEDI